MKLGKKKTSESSADDQPAKQAVKKTGKGRAASGTGLKRLNTVALGQALVVVLSAVVATALVHFLVVQPAASERFEVRKAIEADAADESV